MDVFSIGVGVCIGLGLAASGWTAAKLGAWASAKVKLLEAQALHHTTAAAAASAVSAAASMLKARSPEDPFTPAPPASGPI
jgi:type IV secretory pathway TrbL component